MDLHEIISPSTLAGEGPGERGDVPVAELKSQLYVASEIAAKFDGLSC